MTPKITATPSDTELARFDPSSMTGSDPDNPTSPLRANLAKRYDPSRKNITAREVFGYANDTTSQTAIDVIEPEDEDWSSESPEQNMDHKWIEDEIASFEDNYGMTSVDFWKKWVEGKTDDIQFATVWASLYELQKNGYRI